MNQLKKQIQLHETNLSLQKSLLLTHSREVTSKTHELLTAPTMLVGVFITAIIVGSKKHAKHTANLAERLSTTFTLVRLWQKFTQNKNILH
jgi:hypothetical protein